MTYEELIEEAISLIPFYSREWTNYNQSDPGITILQNFAAFQYLQQESIAEITGPIKRGLLKLAGITSNPFRGSRILLSAVHEPEENGFYLPAHLKMYVGDTCFETVKAEYIPPKRLSRIFLEQKGQLSEVTGFVAPQAASGISVFGDPVEAGRGIWLEFLSLPPPGETLAVYMDVKDEAGRNPFEEDSAPEFAKLIWQCYIGNGWENIETEDGTRYFLEDGRLVFHMPGHRAERYPGGYGYMIRCRLIISHYDLPPKILSVYDRVVEVEQRTTAAEKFEFRGGGMAENGYRIEVFSSLAESGCYEVFARETADSDYIRYKRAGKEGHRYRELSRDNGRLLLEFEDGERVADCGSAAVAVVCYDEVLLHRMIGRVYGYDGQIMDLEQLNNIIPEGFCIIAELEDGAGGKRYRFVEPGRTGEEDLGYELYMDEGRLCIKNPGYGRECGLYLCSCATTLGAEAHVRRGSMLRAGERSLLAVTPSYGGSSYETVEELEERLAGLGNAQERGVLASDYEELASKTPGLAIDKVRAWMDSEKNQVFVAVRQKSCDQPCPALTEIYSRTIWEYLEKRRMITVHVNILGPRYVPVHIRGRICVKSQYENAPDRITSLIRDFFLQMADQAGFGGTVEFARIFEKVQEQDCVFEVCELRAHPSPGAVLYGSGITLERDCLACLGDMNIVFFRNRRTVEQEEAIWGFQ